MVRGQQTMDGHFFRVLGQLRVAGPNGTVDLKSVRQRTILASLILNANHLVPTEVLIDAVWPEAPPNTARDQIYTCISQLRRTLAAAGLEDRIVTRFPGYVLEVRKGELDLDTFEQQAGACLTASGAAMTRETVTMMRHALSLFSGDPFADVDSQAIRRATQPILERKMALAERCVETELEHNLFAEALTDLAGLIAENPLQERLRAMQITALHRAGRQADALAAYQETRSEIIEQLGVEPSAELHDAYMKVLADEADFCRSVSVAQPRAIPRQLPPDLLRFHVRTRQLGQVREQMLAWTAAGRGGLVAISGRVGVGKTTFARLIARELSGSYDDGQLYAELSEDEARPVSTAHVLGSFLLALGVDKASIPVSVDERARLYQDLVADRRLLVLLDGAASEEQVLRLLPRSTTSLVIVTSRSRLGGLLGALHTHLDLPDTETGVKILEMMIGRERVAAEPVQAHALVRQCGRLPYALQIAATRLNSRPHWTLARLTERLTDPDQRLDELSHHDSGVRDKIMESYNALGSMAQSLFDRLALCPTPSFPEWICAPLLGCDPDDALEQLETLADAQLVEVSRDPVGCRYHMDDLVTLVARERTALHEPDERDTALRHLLATCLYLIDEVNHSDVSEVVGPDGESVVRRLLPRRWVRRHIPDPLSWVNRELPLLEAAMRRAGEIGADDVCWDLAVGIAVSRMNQDLARGDIPRRPIDQLTTDIANSACRNIIRIGGSLDRIWSYAERLRLRLRQSLRRELRPRLG
jgi:DNA-binding SARP family transcriptional activator